MTTNIFKLQSASLFPLRKSSGSYRNTQMWSYDNGIDTAGQNGLHQYSPPEAYISLPEHYIPNIVDKNFKTHVLSHKHTYIAIGTGSAEGELVLKRHGEPKTRTDLSILHYKKVEDLQTEIKRDIKV